MRIGSLCCIAMLLFFSVQSAEAKLLPSNHVIPVTLQLLPGQSENCAAALGGQSIHGTFYYIEIPSRLTGTGFFHLDNPTVSEPPIENVLDEDGDTDRLGFTYYYLPAYPINMNHQLLGLRGVILNICPDHTVPQAGVMIDLPSGEGCLMTTTTWNYCR